MSELRFFVRESNRIEGITRPPYKRELDAHADFLKCDTPQVADLARFVAVVAPGKPLRDREGLNVRVGNHIAPPGGPEVLRELFTILERVYFAHDPYLVHQAYEHLHPFMDGNGRSGRAIWLWQMIRQKRAHYVLKMGFLHIWYYQSLSGFCAPQPPADITTPPPAGVET